MIAWLLRKFKRMPPPPPSPTPQEEAEKELQHARKELAKSERQAEVAKRVAGDLQRVNRENHFAERVLLALRGTVE